MLIIVLEGLNESEDLINVSANWGIVDLHMSEDSIAIDDIGGSEVDSLILGKATIVSTKLFGQISEHGDLHATKTTLVSGFVGPFHMGEVGIDGSSDDLGTY